jgi:uncharacterized SAM-binding protein YcdF (DUF218 family)
MLFRSLYPFGIMTESAVLYFTKPIVVYLMCQVAVPLIGWIVSVSAVLIRTEPRILPIPTRNLILGAANPMELTRTTLCLQFIHFALQNHRFAHQILKLGVRCGHLGSCQH